MNRYEKYWHRLKVGSAFYNSNGNRTVVIAISNTKIECKTSRGTYYNISKAEFVNRTRDGYYNGFSNLLNNVQKANIVSEPALSNYLF